MFTYTFTKSTLLERFKEHRQAKNNPIHANAPFELQPTLSISHGEAREAYLIKRGKTLSPDGLTARTNVELYLILTLVPNTSTLLCNYLLIYHAIYCSHF